MLRHGNIVKMKLNFKYCTSNCWRRIDSGTYYKCYVRPIAADEKAVGNIISNTYPTVAHNDTENFGIRIPTSLGIYMSIPANYEGSLQEFCQANPTTVVYELASPYYEEISSNPKDTVVDFYANGTLEVQSAVYPLSIEFTSFEEE